MTVPDDARGPEGPVGAPPPAPPEGSAGSGRAAVGAALGLGAAVLAGVIGVARLATTWVGARHGGPSASSWVYLPGWTALEVAAALVATAAGAAAVTAPDGRRPVPALALLAAVAVLGWSLSDGAYQVVASLYYLNG